METKICITCGVEKELSQFRFCGKNYRGDCKKCENKKSRERNAKNREHIRIKQKEWREKNKEEIKKNRIKYYDREQQKEYNKKYYEEHKEYYKHHHKIYTQKYREQIREKQRKWKKNNIEKVREYQRKDALKRKQDPLKKLELQLRNMVKDAFKRKKYRKSKKLELICGINSKELVNYLLKTFKDIYGYEWNGIEKVHIDHIKPLKSANTIEDVYELNYYTNLQLLKAKDNLQKGVKDNWVLQS